MYFLSHEDLALELWDTHKPGAVFLLACGLAWQACVRKGFTKEWRDVQLNQLKVVIYSILGVKQDIGFDKRIMAAERTAGIVTNQLLDLMSWINARRQIHERIPLGVLSRMIETPLTTPLRVLLWNHRKLRRQQREPQRKPDRNFSLHVRLLHFSRRL